MQKNRKIYIKIKELKNYSFFEIMKNHYVPKGIINKFKKSNKIEKSLNDYKIHYNIISGLIKIGHILWGIFRLKNCKKFLQKELYFNEWFNQIVIKSFFLSTCINRIGRCY